MNFLSTRKKRGEKRRSIWTSDGTLKHRVNVNEQSALFLFLDTWETLSVYAWIISHIRVWIFLLLFHSHSFGSLSLLILSKFVDDYRFKNWAWNCVGRKSGPKIHFYDLYIDIPFAPLFYNRNKENPMKFYVCCVGVLELVVNAIAAIYCYCCCCCCYTCLRFKAGSKTIPKNVIFLCLLSDYHNSSDWQ